MKAVLRASWASGATTNYPVQYNPTELSLEKSVQLAEITIPGIDAPLQQFVRGQAEKLTVELFFDTTEEGTGRGARSVTEETDRIYELAKIDPERHAPPIVTFIWNAHFAGDHLSERSGNQARHNFTGVVESLSQRFTLFSPEGVPLRARINLTLREYRPLEQQLAELRLSSPDKTHAHVVGAGERLSSISHRYYGRTSKWREVAIENGIDDPRRLEVGAVLRVPRLDPSGRRGGGRR
ncbi:MAG: peptidoglycan-binding protein [Deltaproteobacteria bacterium]|jgi:nucleoid-associated protein YgaU